MGDLARTLEREKNAAVCVWSMYGMCVECVWVGLEQLELLTKGHP